MSVWKAYSISINVDDSLDFPDIISAVSESIDAWNDASEITPRFVLSESGVTLYAGPTAGHLALALRRVYSGEIVSAEVAFDIQQMRSGFDWQNVITHELGHVLGLDDEFEDKEATMYRYVGKGETKKQTIEETDRAELDYLYSALEPGCSISYNTNSSWEGMFLVFACFYIWRRKIRKLEE